MKRIKQFGEKKNEANYSVELMVVGKDGQDQETGVNS